MPRGQKTENIKQKQCCNRYSKNFKNGPHQKKILKKKKKPFEIKKQAGNKEFPGTPAGVPYADHSELGFPARSGGRHSKDSVVRASRRPGPGAPASCR